MLASLADLGERLELPQNQDRQQTAKNVLSALSSSQYRWLLVYDNAERPEEISPLVPSVGGDVILTSRNPDWTTKWHTIEVDVFKRTESIELLDLFAFLGPEPISTGLLRSGRTAILSEPLGRSLRDRIQLNRVIRELPRYGLAKIDPDGQKIQVHRLVQAVLRTTLDEARRVRSQNNVRNLLGVASPSGPDNPANWSVHAEVGPHIMPADLIRSENYDARHVVLDQARYLYLIGDYTASRALGAAMVEAWTKAAEDGGLGPDHEQTLLAYRHLANPLRMMGEYAEARRLVKESFKALRDNPEFGDDHEYTIGVALGLGIALSIAGDLSGALAADAENLQRHEFPSGPQPMAGARYRR